MVDKMRSLNYYYIVLDYCNGGDLHTFLSIQTRINEEAVRLIAK